MLREYASLIEFSSAFMGQKASRGRRRHDEKRTRVGRKGPARQGSNATNALVAHLQDIKEVCEKTNGQHNDVEILLAATSEHAFPLPQSWRGKAKMAKTHELLLRVWKEAFELEGVDEPRTTMGKKMFENLLHRYVKSVQDSSDELIETALQYGLDAVREIIEHGIEFDKATAPQNVFTEKTHEELRSQLQNAREWISKEAGNVQRIQATARDTYVQGFQHNMNVLVDAFLENMQKRTYEVLCAATKTSLRERLVVIPLKPDEELEWFVVGPSANLVKDKDPSAVVSRCPFSTVTVSSDILLKENPAMEKDLDADLRYRKFSDFVDRATTDGQEISLATMIKWVGIHRIHLETLERSGITRPDPESSESQQESSKGMDGTISGDNILSPNTSMIDAEKKLGYTFSARFSSDAKSDATELVHIDEFIRWFLPAVNEILTTQKFMAENNTTFADVGATLERYGNPLPEPFD